MQDVRAPLVAHRFLRDVSLRATRCYGILLSAALACTTSPAAPPVRFEVGLIGDLPYTQEDEQKFPSLLKALNAAPLAFVVHLGDIESDARGFAVFETGTQPCTDQTLQARRALFDTSTHPFILTPGDNDWTDCRYSVPSFDPQERLAKLRELFFAGDRSLGQRTLAVRRQSDDPRYAKYRENARWTLGRVLFVTVHAVGSNDNFGYDAADDAEFAERSAANLAWLGQAFEQARRPRRAPSRPSSMPSNARPLPSASRSSSCTAIRITSASTSRCLARRAGAPSRTSRAWKSSAARTCTGCGRSSTRRIRASSRSGRRSCRSGQPVKPTDIAHKTA